MKLLYGVLEVGNHWFATYHIYHKNKLGIKEFIYNLYLLYSFGPFGMIGIQTDNILILANNNFAGKKKSAIQIAKIMTKD